ncbi:MAG TPA: class I SAM-dependent methyltransferase [Candidatus Paceibacterota bacterium]|jgi:ubiquinone/menaquinone biosynthesis C-methylase UbiE
MTAGPKYGEFGRFSTTYDAARPPMPSEVLDYLASRTNLQNVLDVGCGTGIITRQIHRLGIPVSGSDIDEEMIRTARAYNDGINYAVAPAEQLPFADASFNTVTCFSAFHWFANEKAAGEIRRVLVPGGHVFIANREYGKFREGFLQVLRPFIEGDIPNIKASYEPEILLEACGYADIDKKTLTVTESLSDSEALSYVLSTSVWNIIPEDKKQLAKNELHAYFKSIAIDNQVLRPTEIRTVLAQSK